MFDLKDTIIITLPTEVGDKDCELQHPTDEQWTERFNKRYTLIRNLGNQQNEQKAMNKEAADSKLLSEVQVNKETVTFNEFEAVTIIEQLAMCEVVDVIRSGSSLQITLNTILGEVIHHVRMPSQKDLKYAIDSSAKVRGGRLNTNTVTIFLPPTSDLYNSIVDRVEGYSTKEPKEVPIIHKYKVIDVIQGEVQNITVNVKAKKDVSSPFPTSPGPTSLT